MKGKIAILVLLSYFIPSTKGLQCFTCGYVEGLPSDRPIRPPFDQLIDPSCKSGSTPNDRFTRECDPGITHPICGSAYAKITLPAPIRAEIEATLRGCLGKMEGLTEGCQKSTVENMLKTPNLDPTLREYLEQLEPTDMAEICGCSTDKCTAVGNEGGAGGSDATITRIAQNMLLCPLILPFIEKFLLNIWVLS